MVDLETIISQGVLRRVWKQFRFSERQVHLTQAPLVRDSTGGVAFELTLKETLNYLSSRVQDGSYRPHPPLEVEVAKSRLLRRRFAFLMPEDALVLRALVAAGSPALLSKMSEWVSFGRTAEAKKGQANKTNPVIQVDYEGWWIKWIRYRKLLNAIAGDPKPYLFISDVVNFFGSVDLTLLRSRLSSSTNLDTRAIDLLFFLLDRIRPSERYGPRGSLGLPVVADDTSRVLAHFYLLELDKELAQEGKENRYTRWVDDMVVSVADEIEGGKVAARIERALSRLGLVANSLKTRLIAKEEFRKHHFEGDNEYLDEIHEKTERGITLTQEERRGFEEHLGGFLKHAREGHWSRVLRRYYTESRRVRSKTLRGLWREHLWDLPTEGTHIFDYLSFLPGSLKICEEIFEFLRREGGLHEDLEILAYEALLLVPFPNDCILRNYVTIQTYHHYSGAPDFGKPTGYVRGLQTLVIYKFGTAKAAGLLAKSFPSNAVKSPDFATYAFPVLVASGSHREPALAAMEHVEDPRILRLRTLVRLLEEGDERTHKMVLALLEPRITKLPTRAIVNPRALPLVKIAQRSSSTAARKRLQTSLTRVATKVLNSKGRDKGLIDRITLSHLM